MKKKIKVKIIDYDYFGRGISKEDGKICFVPHTKIGFSGICVVDREKKQFYEAHLDPCDEEKTDCPYFATCGGCQLRHLKYAEQKSFKIAKVKALFKQNAGIFLDEIDMISSSYESYRNKAVFHLKDGQVGFYQEGTNHLLPITTCRLLPDKIEKVLQELLIFAQENRREMTATVRLLGGKVMLSLEEEKTHTCSFSFKSVDSFFYQGILKKGLPFLEVEILGTRFRVTREAFFQVNLKGMVLLYEKVLSFLREKEAKKVLDLYCGVGSISLVIAKEVEKVFGVEVIEEAVLSARENAKKNGIVNVTFQSGKVEEVLSFLPKDYDTVIVDPPRRGLDKKTKAFLLENAFKTIIYVSCDPATLARDVKDLNAVYCLEKLTLIDMFPATYHVECVSLLSLKVLEK